MDRIFSTRLDEATLDELSRVARRLGISKRQFLQEAIQLRAQQFSRQEGADVWAETLGAWRRREGARSTIRQARQAFQRSLERHHRRS